MAKGTTNGVEPQESKVVETEVQKQKRQGEELFADFMAAEPAKRRALLEVILFNIQKGTTEAAIVGFVHHPDVIPTLIAKIAAHNARGDKQNRDFFGKDSLRQKDQGVPSIEDAAKIIWAAYPETKPAGIEGLLIDLRATAADRNDRKEKAKTSKAGKPVFGVDQEPTNDKEIAAEADLGRKLASSFADKKISGAKRAEILELIAEAHQDGQVIRAVRALSITPGFLYGVYEQLIKKPEPVAKGATKPDPYIDLSGEKKNAVISGVLGLIKRYPEAMPTSLGDKLLLNQAIRMMELRSASAETNTRKKGKNGDKTQTSKRPGLVRAKSSEVAPSPGGDTTKQ